MNRVGAIANMVLAMALIPWAMTMAAGLTSEGDQHSSPEESASLAFVQPEAEPDPSPMGSGEVEAEAKSFGKVDANNNNKLSRSEVKRAGIPMLINDWDKADSDGNGSLSKQEYAAYLEEHEMAAKGLAPEEDFTEIDDDGNEELTRAEVRAAGYAQLLQKWGEADDNDSGTLDRHEFVSFMERQYGTGKSPQKSFQQVDDNGDLSITKAEARQAGLSRLVEQWKKADRTNNGTLSEQEYTAFMKKPGEDKAAPMTVGLNKFASPETALWDERADVYLVSNINGKLTGRDSNGFISRVLPDGTISDLKWVDGSKPEIALHGPKGMIFHGEFLVVADVGGVRFFDRTTGQPMHSIIVPDSHMLNDLALGADGLIYVSDVGSEVAEPPGAVYKLDAEGQPVQIAEGIEYDRPDGLISHGDGLLVAPFEAHAKELYVLSSDGTKTPFTTVPTPKLDGLLRLPDESIVVTSWQGRTIYRITDGQAEPIAKDIPSPAQIGYDRKRKRLLVPVLRDNKMLIYPLDVQE